MLFSFYTTEKKQILAGITESRKEKFEGIMSRIQG